MINRKKLLLSCLLIGLIASVLYGVFAFNATKASVKGVSTNISSTPTLTPSSTPISTPIPTPTNKPISVKAQPTPQAKQYGGWYWQPELGRAQRWLGTDSQGKDIWSDTGDPTPTPTPTPTKSNTPSTNTSKKIDELQFGTSTHDATPTHASSSSGTSSSGTVSVSQSISEVKTQVKVKNQ